MVEDELDRLSGGSCRGRWTGVVHIGLLVIRDGGIDLFVGGWINGASRGAGRWMTDD